MRQCIVLLLVFIMLAVTGCAAILEGDMLSVSEHSGAPHIRQPEDVTEASSYDELKAAMLELVAQRSDTGLIYIYSYDGDVQEDLNRACEEIKLNDPLGAYVVSEMNASATKIVSTFEVEVSISFKRTKNQIDSIVSVSTLRYLKSELQSYMSGYRDEAAIRTTLQNTAADDIAAYVKELYYQNPGAIVMMPAVAVEIFPENGAERIIELRFGYIERASILRSYGASLTKAVRHNAEAASGDSDGAILLSLAENLAGSCIYDEKTAKTISEHGAQNFSATAYGALVNGSAVGEGYAMAYKALCDELGFDCQVVPGYLDGMVHAWNLVQLNGDYYHIDVSAAARTGVENIFLLNDDTIPENYTWDRAVAYRSSGSITYKSVINGEA